MIWYKEAGEKQVEEQQLRSGRNLRMVHVPQNNEEYKCNACQDNSCNTGSNNQKMS